MCAGGRLTELESVSVRTAPGEFTDTGGRKLLRGERCWRETYGTGIGEQNYGNGNFI